MMIIIFVDDMVHMVEVKDAQQKSSLASLPPGKHQAAMTTILRNTKEIIVAREKQQNISRCSNDATHKSQVFYTQSGDQNHPHA
jgi:hypothetical protein